MSKGGKDKGDWRTGSDAFFRAVRADHEATAADFARVEAELARRLAAVRAAQPQSIKGTWPTITRAARTLTLGKVAKLSIGLSLLAAGSYAAMRTLDSVEPRSSQVAGSQEFSAQPPPFVAPAPVQALEAPAEARQTSAVPESPDPPQPRARREGTPRAASSRSALRDSAAPKSLSASGSHSRSTRADANTAVAAPANVRLAARSSSDVSAAPSPTAANVNASQQQPGDASIASAAVSAKVSSTSSTDSSSRETTGTARKSSAAKIPAEPSRSPKLAAAEGASAPSGSQSQTRRAAIRLGEAEESADVRAELALIERMQAVMRAGQATQALELCAEHARRWPRGVFTEEREAVRAIASCELRSDGAAARAELFLKLHPRAPTAPRVAAACAPLSAAASEPASRR